MNCPNGITATGVIPKAGVTIACDKEMLGKQIEIEGIGVRTCQDTGGKITEGRIDLYVDNIDEAYKWGVRELAYKVL